MRACGCRRASSTPSLSHSLTAADEQLPDQRKRERERQTLTLKQTLPDLNHTEIEQKALQEIPTYIAGGVRYIYISFDLNLRFKNGNT